MHSSLGYENSTFYNRGIFFRLDANDIHIGKLEINNNTLHNLTSGFYNSGVHVEKYSGAVIDDLEIYNNIVVKQVGPVDMDPRNRQPPIGLIIPRLRRRLISALRTTCRI